MSNERLNYAFGAVLRKLRTSKGLSQEEVAHRAQTTQSYISFLETGKHSASLGTVDLLATALGVSLAKLVEAVEEEREGSE